MKENRNPTEVHIAEAAWADYKETLAGIRHRVFVIEQNVPESIEQDEHDPEALHLLARTKTGDPIGTARMTPEGKIGRVAVLREFRGSGVGTSLLKKLFTIARSRHLKKVYLHAQEAVVPYYTRLGFIRHGERFFEADIPHVLMDLDLE
jgi:predicted GNAT family N-acyltransferase